LPSTLVSQKVEEPIPVFEKPKTALKSFKSIKALEEGPDAVQQAPLESEITKIINDTKSESGGSSFSKESIKDIIHAFSAKLETDSDKMAVESDFTLEGQSLTFMFPNALMAEKFADYKTDIFHEIAKASGSQAWEINSEIAAIDTKIKIYKTQDKFEAMVAKNPLLLKFKEELNLDLDF
jgi:hypothetical protein